MLPAAAMQSGIGADGVPVFSPASRAQCWPATSGLLATWPIRRWRRCDQIHVWPSLWNSGVAHGRAGAAVSRIELLLRTVRRRRRSRSNRQCISFLQVMGTCMRPSQLQSEFYNIEVMAPEIRQFRQRYR
ncbi:hypothetical protein VPH35_127144 [Triticum aestivum]